ncbi:nSTAND1 domain-containing NTPase [Streptomyces sp. NBC_01304]|uniref:nSTAND1 domain-containing NTPase n=1 Tax=Streptomyces sp. NBC_01304 TaxID=2903818 RepID=UPI002E14F4A3|nr:DNA-binding protein [Streptomyces sp. NBC_01304]
MGRPETEIDPARGPVQQLAFELRKLRQEAGGITYRQMVRQVGFSVSTLSRAAGGEQLPLLPVVLAYVTACGGDAADWQERWQEAARDQARQDAPRSEEDAPAPYRGLARFDVDDEHLFFGREELTEDLLHKVGAHRVVVVIGPSGSGKSSLLRAGLIPRLRRLTTPLRPAAVRILTPGEHPEGTHGQVCTPAPGDGDTWLVVDQFEEVFTLCHDTRERSAFLARLLAAADPASRLRVVLGVRADFYAHCLGHPELAAVMRESSVPVGPMSADELRAAIVKPAQAGGLIVERSLTAQLIGEAAGEPGSLPLLSHALLETWRRSRGRTLTREAYAAAGGIHGAIAQTAEHLYTHMSTHEALQARRILLRLITPGDGTQDTRRPIGRDELDFADPDGLARVLAALSAARLVILDDDTVDLAHEALITAWPRLRGWIDEERERLRTRRDLTEAARTWHSLGRDPSALYRGSRLAGAEELLADPHQLTVLEREFLDGGRVARTREQRRRRALAAFVAVLVVVALLAGGIAWQQSRTSDRQHRQAEARRLAAVADSMRPSDPTTALQLSVAAWKLADTTETRSALMGAMTQKEEGDFPVRAAAPTAFGSGPTPSDAGAGIGTPYHHLTADGRQLISVTGDQIRVVDLRTRRLAHTYRGIGTQETFDDIRLSDDSRTLAMADANGRVRLWDVRAGRAKGTLGQEQTNSWEFSPSGRLLVTDEPDDEPAVGEEVPEPPADDEEPVQEDAELSVGSATMGPGLVRVWDVRSRRQLLRVSDPSGFGGVTGLAVSPDDRLLAACRGQLTLEVWDIRQQRRTKPLKKTKGVGCAEGQVRFTSDSRRLLQVTDTSIRVWDLRTGRSHTGIKTEGVESLHVSTDGTFVTTYGQGEVRLWRLSSPEAPVFRYALVNDDPSDLALDADDGSIRYVNGEGTAVRTLAVGAATNPPWRQHPLELNTLSPDGHALATLDRQRATSTLTLTDTRTGRPLALQPDSGIPCPAPAHDEDQDCIDYLAYSGDSRYLAHIQGWVGLTDATPQRLPVSVWDTRTGRRHARFDVPAVEIADISFSADGRAVHLSRFADESIDVWDIHRGKRTRTLHGLPGTRTIARHDGKLLVDPDGAVVDLPSGRIRPRTLSDGSVSDLKFSPDGTYLAVGDDTGSVTLWDADVRKQVAVLSGLHAGPRLGESEMLSALAFSGDGRLLAVGGDAGTVRIWDVASNRPLGTALRTAGDPVISLAFSTDGHTLYAAGQHVTLQKFAIDPAQQAAQVCRRVGSGLSRTDWATYLPGLPFQETCR